jgi:hypothetical protein
MFIIRGGIHSDNTDRLTLYIIYIALHHLSLSTPSLSYLKQMEKVS